MSIRGNLAVSPDIFREPYAFKNSSMNFIFRFMDNPLWLRSLFFRSEKCPSIALVVFGIFNCMLSYRVNDQGKLFFKLLQALRSFLWVYALLFVMGLRFVPSGNHPTFRTRQSRLPQTILCPSQSTGQPLPSVPATLSALVSWSGTFL